MNEDKNQTVSLYFESQPESVKEAQYKLREYILEAAPDAVEMFNYNIPAYALIAGGKREQQVMIAGYKKHVGLYPHLTVMVKFSDEFKDYKKGKGSVQFPLDKPLPKELIIRMVRYRKELLNKELKE